MLRASLLVAVAAALLLAGGEQKQRCSSYATYCRHVRSMRVASQALLLIRRYKKNSLPQVPLLFVARAKVDV